MNQTLAIIANTWRQSRQQVVFIVMLVLLGITVTIGIALPSVQYNAEGAEVIGFIFDDDEPSEFLKDSWYGQYHSTLLLQGQANVFESDSDNHPGILTKEMKEIISARTIETSLKEKGAQAWTSIIMSICYSIGLLLFIAACSGYFPDLLAAGAIDVVLSKPISRTRVFFSKYLGGLFLFAIAMTTVALLLFVGLGLRLGVWNSGLLLTLPLTIFSASVLYGFLSFIGILKRSATLCIVVGYSLYLLVDSALGTLMQLQMMGLLDEIAWLEKTGRWARYTLPNFEMLKSGAVNHILDVPSLPWMPVGIAAAWLAASLAFSNYLFCKRDY